MLKIKLMHAQTSNNQSLPNYNPISLAITRRVMPSLFANKLVGVQPMSTPVGYSYAIRTQYGDLIDKEYKKDIQNKIEDLFPDIKEEFEETTE